MAAMWQYGIFLVFLLVPQLEAADSTSRNKTIRKLRTRLSSFLSRDQHIQVMEQLEDEFYDLVSADDILSNFSDKILDVMNTQQKMHITSKGAAVSQDTGLSPNELLDRIGTILHNNLYSIVNQSVELSRKLQENKNMTQDPVNLILYRKINQFTTPRRIETIVCRTVNRFTPEEWKSIYDNFKGVVILNYTCAVPVDFFIWFLAAYGPRTFGINPVQVGFFCNDESIRLPKLPEIISGDALYIYVFGLVCTCIIIVELYCIIFVDSGSELVAGESGKSKFERFLLRTLTVFSYFMIAFVIVYISTSIAKKTTGRLRPKFLDICRPAIDIEACSTQPVYITEYQCSVKDEGVINDARSSFFSGHSSFSMIAAAFSALYVYARLSNAFYSQAVVPFIQFGLLSSGTFIGWTRYVDHNHHWSDILVGQLVGAAIAYWIVTKVAKMFPTRKLV